MKENKIPMGYKLVYGANLSEGIKKFSEEQKHFKRFFPFFFFKKKACAFPFIR